MSTEPMSRERIEAERLAEHAKAVFREKMSPKQAFIRRGALARYGIDAICAAMDEQFHRDPDARSCDWGKLRIALKSDAERSVERTHAWGDRDPRWLAEKDRRAAIAARYAALDEATRAAVVERMLLGMNEFTRRIVRMTYGEKPRIETPGALVVYPLADAMNAVLGRDASTPDVDGADDAAPQAAETGEAMF